MRDLVVDCKYLDVLMEPELVFEHCTKKGYKVFAYMASSRGYFDPSKSNSTDVEQVAIFKEGKKVKISARALRIEVFGAS